MEWTQERRYRKVEEISPDEMKQLKERVNHSPWRQTYHIQPSTGLLNDPNGFSYYNGEYHLFYQWFPLGAVHGIKYWYHMKSIDLIHWEEVGIGIKPDCEYDSHGAFSGSGIEHEGKLYLLYTGNTRDENWVRHPYQCLAMMDEHNRITKWPVPIISEVPKGYSEHFRDPKVWKENDQFYMVIGAQRTNETGIAILYHSHNLIDWTFQGEIEAVGYDFGFMWECPDYFTLEDKGVFLFCPQGLQEEGDFYQNIYQSGYVIGSKLDVATCSFQHGPFTELDRGFDFYAPQTMLDDNGRRILIGWMGLPDIEYPTDEYGWAHCLTLPRELSIVNGKLRQQPVKELEMLRGLLYEQVDILADEMKMYEGFSGEQYELRCAFSAATACQYGIEFRVGDKEKTVLYYEAAQKKVVLDRSASGMEVAASYGMKRACYVDSDMITFHLFVDTSSVEIFINDGEEVFTSRIFPRSTSTDIRFFAAGGEVHLAAMKWDYTR